MDGVITAVTTLSLSDPAHQSAKTGRHREQYSDSPTQTSSPLDRKLLPFRHPSPYGRGSRTAQAASREDVGSSHAEVVFGRPTGSGGIGTTENFAHVFARILVALHWTESIHSSLSII